MFGSIVCGATMSAQRRLFCGATTSGPANPRILPTGLYAVVVATEPNVCAIAVADLYRLVRVKAPCDGASDAGACLFSRKVLYSVQAGDPTPPEIAVQ